MSRRDPAHQRHIAVLVYDGVRALDLAGPTEVFEIAREMGCGYTTGLYSTANSRTVRCASGMTVHATAASELTNADTLLVPGGDDPARSAAPWLSKVLRAQLNDVRRIAALGTGCFALAAAGILDGRRTTTHWRHLDAFAARHPTAVLDRESAFTRDGPVWTSAGAAAGVDLALALVGEDHGAAVAQEIAKELVLPGRRMEGHPQLSVAARTPRPKHPEIDRLLVTISVDPAGDYELDSVAAHLGISARHLARLFKAQVGVTLRQYVHEVRLENAVGLVLAGESFHAAARRSGLHGGARVRDHLAGRLRVDARGAEAVSVHAG